MIYLTMCGQRAACRSFVSLKFLLFHPYSLSCPSLETVVRGIPPGKSAASERHAIEPRLGPAQPERRTPG